MCKLLRIDSTNLSVKGCIFSRIKVQKLKTTPRKSRCFVLQKPPSNCSIHSVFTTEHKGTNLQHGACLSGTHRCCSPGEEGVESSLSGCCMKQSLSSAFQQRGNTAPLGPSTGTKGRTADSQVDFAAGFVSLGKELRAALGSGERQH